MRLFSAVFLVCAFTACAQTQEDPEVARAKLELAKVQGLVAMGALPRVEEQKAAEAVAAAEDNSVIHKYSFQQDLTEDQADQLTAAAGRQLERKKQAFDRAEKLVQNGVAPQLSLDTFLRDLDFARKECDLAETRARLAREATQMALLEETYATHGPPPAVEGGHPVAEHFPGNGIFNPLIFREVETAFEGRFGKPLPVSANGETAVHRALGFDHRGRIDVAIQPDQPEGVWLRQYLIEHNVPFFAFRAAVPGQATGAHFHLGPPSTRLLAERPAPGSITAASAGQ